MCLCEIYVQYFKCVCVRCVRVRFVYNSSNVTPTHLKCVCVRYMYNTLNVSVCDVSIILHVTNTHLKCVCVRYMYNTS